MKTWATIARSPEMTLREMVPLMTSSGTVSQVKCSMKPPGSYCTCGRAGHVGAAERSRRFASSSMCRHVRCVTGVGIRRRRQLVLGLLSQSTMKVLTKRARRHAAAKTHHLPQTMRAAAIDRFGGPEVLTLHTLPVPTPGPSEVLIAIDTAGVGSWDADM